MRFVWVILLSILTASSVMGESLWSIERPMESIPDEPLTGSIFGRDFTIGSATLNRHALILESKDREGPWLESRIHIFVKLDDGQTEWTVTPDAEGMPPHVHMSFYKESKGSHGTLMFTQEYSMRLVLTEVSDTSVTGRIHISLPDYKKSYLVGSFTAERKE